MQADAESLAFLANEGQITVPFFQRPYVWGRKNWESLLEDLTNYDKSHFLGSLILKQVPKRIGKHKEAVVIDGQQRLTTLSILIRALYDSFDQSLRANTETFVQTHLFFKRLPSDTESVVKIRHSRLDAKHFRSVITGALSPSEIATLPKDANPILLCYAFFRAEIEKLTMIDRQTLFDQLLDTENKMIVVISLNDGEDEQAIFDTINSAGVRLSGSDVIKNALYQRVIEHLGNEEAAVDIYKETWEQVFQKDDETQDYWNTSRATGRLMRDNLELLLHSVAVIQGFFDPDHHTLSDLPHLYKAHIQKLPHHETLDLVKALGLYASIYRQNFQAFGVDTLFSFDDQTKRLFHALDVFQVSTFHPFLLHLMYKLKDSPSDLEKKLSRFERLIVRRSVANQENKNYNKMCKDFIKNDALLDTIAAETTDQDVERGIAQIANRTATFALFWVELHRRFRDTKHGLKDLKYCYSLEHVMPQKHEEHWSVVEVVDALGNPILEPDTAKEVRRQLIYSLGNMTLLTSGLNSSLRNFTFERKMNGEGRRKGVRSYAELSITKDDIVLPFEKGDLVWNEGKIRSRAGSLLTEVLEVWPA